MRLLTLFVSCIALTGASQAQAPNQMLDPVDLSSPEAAVYSLMRGMYQASPETIDQVMLDDAVFRRVTGDGQVRPDGLSAWRDWVGSLEVGAAHEELFGVTVNQFGDMATVWAPFVLTLNGEIVTCGVNTMTLARVDGDWQSVFGMDTPAPTETCQTFRATYSAP